jgi:hypothetical protein
MMPTMYRRRQWREKRQQPTLEDLRMSEQYVAILCALAAIATALVILLMIFGQPLVDALFGG